MADDEKENFNLASEAAKVGLNWFQVGVATIVATQITILVSTSVTASKVTDLTRNDEKQDRQIDEIVNRQNEHDVYMRVMEADLKGRVRMVEKYIKQ